MRDLGHDTVLGSCFGVDCAPRFTTRTLAGELSVTRIQCDVANNGLSNPLPREDVWLLTMQLRPCPAHELWIDSRPQPTGPLAAGSISIYDLRSDPRVNSISPFANLHFRLPMRALDVIAERSGLGRVIDIPHAPGLGFDDPVISGLAMALDSTFDHPENANQLFVDHITQALANHVAERFSTRQPRQRSARATLSESKLRDIQGALEEQLDGNITLAELGDAAAGLSPHEVSGAFADAVDEAPFRWQLRLRVEKALDFIRSQKVPMEEIAKRCGFADTAHLRRVIAAYGRRSRFVRH